jgi:hypothetical protein
MPEPPFSRTSTVVPWDARECPPGEFWFLLLADSKVVLTKGRLLIA